ELTFTPNWGS
nr:adipokinetic peptide [Phymateus leprosus]